jgi:hypothetical protein
MSFEVHNLKKGHVFPAKTRKYNRGLQWIFRNSETPPPKKKRKKKNVWKTELWLCDNIAKQILFIDR